MDEIIGGGIDEGSREHPINRYNLLHTAIIFLKLDFHAQKPWAYVND